MFPERCDLCGSTDFQEVYSPVGSLRQVNVAVCSHCGLAFSRYAAVPYTRDPRPSGDADWGNIRWAKGFRLDALRPMLTALLNQGGLNRVLDVGANRGSFLEWMLATGESEAAALMTPRPGGEGRSSSCAGSGGGSSAAAAAGDAAGGFFLRGTPLGHPMTCRRELFRGGYSLVRSACRAMRAIC